MEKLPSAPDLYINTLKTAFNGIFFGIVAEHDSRVIRYMICKIRA